MRKGGSVATYALIGGIGSGKSTVCELFARHGAAIVKLDDIGHDILAFPEVVARLRAAFGDGVCDAAGRVVRARLAAAAFDSDERTAMLDAITHPAIMQEAARRIRACAAYPAVIVEVTAGEMTRAALAWADGIIAVSAPEEVRVRRALARGGQSEQDVRARIARQPRDAQRAAVADYVIDNGADLSSVAAHVDAVWRAIARGA